MCVKRLMTSKALFAWTVDKDEVAGQCRLNGDLRRFRIADFADHDAIRIVAQDGAQAAGERQALLLVDGDLQHPRPAGIRPDLRW